MNNYIQSIVNIAEALKNQRCVIFFGSGISKDSGLPTGKDLIKELLDLPNDQRIVDFDLAKAAQIARYRMGDNTLHRRLQNIFLRSDLRPNELHKILALLNSKYYVTTNYDRLFDAVLEELLGVKNLPIIINDRDIPNAEPITYIKLHGDIAEPDTIVLTYEDYDTRFERNSNLLHLLYSLFAQNLVLFVGYSLSDPNILSVVSRIGRGESRHAKGMYIALLSPNRDEFDFFESLNVNVIPIRPTINETESEALQKFLLTLLNRSFNFYFYASSQPQIPSYAIKLQAAISTYRRGDYKGALELFEELSNTKHAIWKKDTGAFMQYAYFRLKILDKLNQWAKIEEAGNKLLDLLRSFENIYPKHVLESFYSQVNITIGVPLIRAALFDKARIYVQATLNKVPDVNISGKDAILLHADRYTLLACIYLNMFYFGESEYTRANLEKAVECLAEAQSYFQSYGDVDGPDETHYLGRFFGLKVFVRVAQIKAEIISFSDQLSAEILENGHKSYREIVEGKNRIPYGRLAGKYSEAIGHLFVAKEHQKQNNTRKASEHYEKCICILTGECLKSDEIFDFQLSPLDQCKFYRALHYAFENQAKIVDNSELVQKANEYQNFFLQTRTFLEQEGMQKDVIQSEEWIYTPLN